MYRDLLTLTESAKVVINRGQLVGFDGKPAMAGGRVLGVAAYDAKEGDDFAVHAIGAFPVVAGAIIQKGQRLMSDAAGAAVPVGADPTAAFGEALADAAPGQKVRVLFR